MRRRDDSKTKDVVGLKNLSTTDEEDLKVMTARKLSNNLTLDLRDVSGPSVYQFLLFSENSSEMVLVDLLFSLRKETNKIFLKEGRKGRRMATDTRLNCNHWQQVLRGDESKLEVFG